MSLSFVVEGVDERIDDRGGNALDACTAEDRRAAQASSSATTAAEVPGSISSANSSMSS